ncbi:MAG: lipoprotein N-acyltransferase Lnb domain-containing protein, partial [Polyangia bacterium]
MRAVLLALVVSALPSVARAAPMIDVYTMGVGDELFSAFGHAAICVTDGEAPRGRCYNYGTADFTTPVPLTWNFIRGRALFWVSTTDVPHMLHYYASVGRAVWRQTLLLTSDEATRVAVALDASAQEGTKYYRYHHFNDNCT